MSFASLGVVHPAALWLLLLAPLPLLGLRRRTGDYPALDLVPPDTASTIIECALRAAAVLLAVLLTLGIAGLHRTEQSVERIGNGAHIVLLLDRSRSMDQPFGGARHTSPLVRGNAPAKGTVARELLSEFAAGRENDLFGLVLFSTYPIQVLPLNRQPQMIQAAIDAGRTGRGLAVTNVGLGIVRALEYFENRPYTGSRIVMLISDGGARLDSITRTRISNLMKRHRAALYWIYIRSRNSPGLIDIAADEPVPETAPAAVLHNYFKSMGAPYRVYDAESSEALAEAIADVNRLQNLPMRYDEVVPRSDLAGLMYALALAPLGLLIVARLLETRQWL